MDRLEHEIPKLYFFIKKLKLCNYNICEPSIVKSKRLLRIILIIIYIHFKF